LVLNWLCKIPRCAAEVRSGGGNNRISRPEDAVSDGVYMLVLFIEGIAGNTEEVKQTVTVAR